MADTTETVKSLLKMDKSEIHNVVTELQGIYTATKNEDYSSSTIEASVVDEIPEVVTTLVDMIGEDPDGNLIIRKDERGNWIDFIGPKGNINPAQMKYNERANFSSIFLRLEQGCYEAEYEQNQDGTIKKTDDGNPIITHRKCTSIAVDLRNLNQACSLAQGANRAILQAKIFGGIKGGMPIGYDGNVDKLLIDMMRPRK
jgi:hypothetical protein